jgi:multiple sugar transport system substrate-binding protein
MLVLVLLLSAAFAFAAGKQEAGKQVTITLMKYADETDTGGVYKPGEGPTDRLLASFMKQHPNITVEPIYLNEKYYPTYTVKLAANEAPDVAWIGLGFWQFVDKGAFLDISAKIKSDKSFALEDIYPKVLDLYKYKGVQYAVPNLVTTEVIAYNKNMFDKAGLAYPKDDWTFEQFVELAKKLTKDVNGDGVIDEWGLADWDTDGMTSLRYGGPFINPEGTKILMDTTIGREVIAAWFNMLGKYTPVPQQSETLFGSGSNMAFRSGKVAMSSAAAWSRGPLRTIKDFDWDVVMYPSYKGQRGVWLSGEAYLIAAQTKHPDEAFELMKFTTTSEWVTTQSASGSSMPSRKSIANSSFFLEPDKLPKNAQAYLKTLDLGRLDWPTPASSLIGEAITPIQDRMLLPAGDKERISDPVEAVKMMAAEAQKALDQYNAGK